MNAPVRVIITTGDSDGIGWEVTSKALLSHGPKKNVQFIVFNSSKNLKFKAQKKFAVFSCDNLEQALQQKFSARTLLLVSDSRPPAHWVEEATKACLEKKAMALVTAPLSKTSIREAGLKDIGHTEILARITQKKNLFMGFVGSKFSVVLLTGHVSLCDVNKELSEERFTQGIQAALKLRSILGKKRRQLPLALVGINPHAGENGIIGHEEKTYVEWVKAHNFTSIQLHGPLVPDAAFLKQNWRRYSVYVCPYHDQGLIPFKLVHGFDDGVHITLGLPFVRTSVDHGTAKEIYGMDRAKSGSMRAAISMAIQLAGGAE